MADISPPLAIPLPPAQYDVAGWDQYNAGNVTVHDWLPLRVRFYCFRAGLKGGLGAETNAAACAVQTGPDQYVIVLPRNLDPMTRFLVQEHELGHIGGWPADHPTE